VVDEQVYYEVTFTAANVNTSKFDRLIAFSKKEIVDNYAVKFSVHNDYISILEKSMPIMVIDDYEVSIRPCEWDHFSELFGPRFRHDASSLEYKKLMGFLTSTKQSLTDLVASDDEYYLGIKEIVTERARSIRVFRMLDECRNVIKNGKPGSNVIRYLLSKMNNRIIKDQLSNARCGRLSDMYLDYGCIPFDEMPFCSSLRRHNPKLADLLDAVPLNGREHELLARRIKNNTEIEGKLFTPISEVGEESQVKMLADKYNESLYHTHVGRRMECFKQHLYIQEFAENSAKIIEELQELSAKGIALYTASVDSWMEREKYIVDDCTKMEALRTIAPMSRFSAN
jgi:hypothetical protein